MFGCVHIYFYHLIVARTELCQMLVYLEMLSEAGHFDVDLWSYKELMAATLNKDSARRSQLENADLIFGGPYWNGDIL